MKHQTETSSSLSVTPLKILSSVSFEKGFHFYSSPREYSGVTATSLYEFVEKMQIISAESVEYHISRGDFSRWINDVIEDAELSAEIANIEEEKSSPETLRNKIIEVIQRRTIELEKLVGGII
jgi:hypothetical protein